MGNVLSREKREQVIALGRLGWSLRRIEHATGVRRETASDHLWSSGIVIRSPGSWGEKSLAKAATSVITGFLLLGAAPAQDGQRTASASEPYRELIALELERGRNAMGIRQDLVDGHGFTGGYQSVRRFVRWLRETGSPDARVIIETRPGEECQVDYGTFASQRLNGSAFGEGMDWISRRTPWTFQHWSLCIPPPFQRDRDRGESHLSTPLTPPDKRVRIRRFDESIPCRTAQRPEVQRTHRRWWFRRSSSSIAGYTRSQLAQAQPEG